MADWKRWSLVTVLCGLLAGSGCGGKKEGASKDAGQRGKGSANTSPQNGKARTVAQKPKQNTDQDDDKGEPQKRLTNETKVANKAIAETTPKSEAEKKATNLVNALVPEKKPPQKGQAKDAKKKSPKKAEVKLVQADKKAFDALIAKHKGQVVVVDFWATWCKPCKEAFPKTVKYNGLYGNKGLTVASMAVEFSLDNQPAALKFLQEQKASFSNLIWNGEAEEAFDAFEFESLPHYKIYDHTGKLHTTMTGKQAEEKLEATIKQLLVNRSKNTAAKK